MDHAIDFEDDSYVRAEKLLLPEELIGNEDASRQDSLLVELQHLHQVVVVFPVDINPHQLVAFHILGG